MVVEKQLLPDPALKGVYDKAVWVYVYRDFTSQGQDREAERIAWRFGVTSWPQLFLADPASLDVLEHTGRETAGFVQAFERARVEAARPAEVLARARAAEERADALEKSGAARLARERLDDEDIVVRFLALRILAEKDPKAVAARAQALLGTPNDPFRYEVCDLLKKEAPPEAREALEEVARDPKASLNPNVLRIRAVQALAACGDARSVEVIAPFARTGEYYNGLTGVAVDALAAIAGRDKAARAKVRAALKASYPAPPPASDARAMPFCVALAKRVHDALAALGEKRPFPEPYDAAARARLMEE